MGEKEPGQAGLMILKGRAGLVITVSIIAVATWFLPPAFYPLVAMLAALLTLDLLSWDNGGIVVQIGRHNPYASLAAYCDYGANPLKIVELPGKVRAVILGHFPLTLLSFLLFWWIFTAIAFLPFTLSLNDAVGCAMSGREAGFLVHYTLVCGDWRYGFTESYLFIFGSSLMGWIAVFTCRVRNAEYHAEFQKALAAGRVSLAHFIAKRSTKRFFSIPASVRLVFSYILGTVFATGVLGYIGFVSNFDMLVETFGSPSTYLALYLIMLAFFSVIGWATGILCTLPLLWIIARIWENSGIRCCHFGIYGPAPRIFGICDSL